MRLTKIICTLGPTAKTREQIAALADGGMNVARINLTHGSREDHVALVRTLHAINDGRRHPVAILVDTEGPEIRTGDRSTPLTVREGENIVFSSHALPGEKLPVVIVNYEFFGKDVRQAENIMLDNGALTFTLEDIRSDGSVVATAQQDGLIGSRRHLNLPGATLSLPPISAKDWDDLAFAIEEKVDFIGLSFVHSAREVEDVRAFLRKYKSDIAIVAKIETRQSLEKLPEIISVSDGIMVARGDLGTEVPFERLPVIQDDLVWRSREAGKPVIVATHMLESMIQSPTPTRAEVTDIAHAALTLTDTTMLSGETANGRHPLVALAAMDRVLREMEAHLRRFPVADTESPGIRSENEARAEVTVRLSGTIEAKALIVITKSGRMARDVSKFRPRIPIFAFTDNVEVQRALQLCYGVYPFFIPLDANPDVTVDRAMEELRNAAWIESGQKVVLVSDAKAHEQAVNTIQVRTMV